MAKQKRKAKYLMQEEVEIKKVTKTVSCRCGDKIEIGNMKGSFNCPSCGNLIKIK